MGDEVLEKIKVVAEWIAPAVSAFTAGQTVYLSFSPGDGTLYSLMFTPPGVPLRFAGGHEEPRLRATEGVVALLNCTPFAAPFNPDGCPDPGYVAEKSRNDNLFTVAAVGIVWSLMDGNTPEVIASAYARLAFQIGEWRAENFDALRLVLEPG